MYVLKGVGPSIIRTGNQLEIIKRPSDAGDLDCLNLMIFTNRIIIIINHDDKKDKNCLQP